MKTLLLENVTCCRCGGSGKFGPTCVHHGICFRCHGAGVTLTKRGRAAQNFLNNLRLRRVDEFRVGDLFFMPGFNAGSYSEPNKWYRITSMQRHDGGTITILAETKRGEHTSTMSYGPITPDSTLRAGFTAEQKAEQARLALEYQATLTKSGTVRKRPAKEVA